MNPRYAGTKGSTQGEANETMPAPSAVTSDDLGKTWSMPETPNLQFPADTEASIKAAWQIVPASKHEPDVIYVGVEPAALFKSVDGGKTFELVRGLWDHPHRPTWQPG